MAAAASASPPRPPSPPTSLPNPFTRPPLPSDTLTDDEWITDWTTTLLSLDHILSQLLTILAHPPQHNHQTHYPVTLHVLALTHHHHAAAEFLLSHSSRCLPLVERALGRVAALLVEHCGGGAGGLPVLYAKPGDRLHVRPYCLPSSHNRPSIGVIRAADVGRLVCVVGNVMRVQSARMYEYASEWQCDKCGGRFYAYADDDQESRIEQPKHCRASDQPAANADTTRSRRLCRSTFISQTATSLARDVQHVRLQDNLHRSHLSLPRSITLRLTDEQCESVKVGDVVQVCGMVRRQWSPLVVGQRVNIDLYLDAYHIAVIGSSAASAAAASSAPAVPASEFDAYWEQQRAAGRGLRARNAILSAVAPSLVGMFVPKLVCMLALIGGVRKEDGGMEGEEDQVGRSDVINIRGDIHVLLVGDAGVGKSVLLQSACGLSPRGVLTTGAGTTSAGLTVAATRAAGSRASTAFTLEPGALVLADSGVCCIDEFNAISKSDRTSLLEAMEQQTISVAKGGQVTKLNTRTAVLAALNPKNGRYDHDLDLSVNTALGSALLSRFDVILALLDTRDEAWDETVAQTLLMALPTTKGSGGAGVKKQEKEELTLDDLKDDDEDEVVCITQRSSTQRLSSTQSFASVSQLLTTRWSPATIHSYINHLKSAFFPVLSPDCETLLKRYYQLQRRSDGRKQARVGVRLLESLIRLTQAHGRLMWRRDECELLDAVMAVVVMEHSVLSCGLLISRKTDGVIAQWSSAMPTTVSVLHASFSRNPDKEYEQWEALILKRLDLSHLRRLEDVGGGGADEAMPQRPVVNSFHMVGSSQQPAQQPHLFWPPLPPSMAIPPTFTPPPLPPPPPPQNPLHFPPPPRQSSTIPPLPSRQSTQPSPPARGLSIAPTQPLAPPPPLPQHPSVVAVWESSPSSSAGPPASILKAPSLSAAPPADRLLSRKSTVSFAAAPPPTPPIAAPTVLSAPAPPAAFAPAPQASHAVLQQLQPSQPDMFTLPSSLPQSQGRPQPSRPANPFTSPAAQPSPAAAAAPFTASYAPPTATLVPSQQYTARHPTTNGSLPTVPQPSPQPTSFTTPTKPTPPPPPPSTPHTTPTSRPPLTPLPLQPPHRPPPSHHPTPRTPSSTLPALPPPAPPTTPSPLSGLAGFGVLGGGLALPPLRTSGVVGVSGVMLSSSFAAAIKANPFIVAASSSSAAGGGGGGVGVGGSGGSGASRWSTGITDEELDELDLGM